MFGCRGFACGISTRFRATQFSFVRGRGAHGDKVRGRVLVAGGEDFLHRVPVVVAAVERRARKYQGACNAGRQGKRASRALGDRAGRPFLNDRLYGIHSDGGQVDANGAVFQQLGLALVFVQGLKAPAPGRLQDGLHGAGLVARPRVDVEVVGVLVNHQQDQSVRGAELSVPPDG